MGGLATARLFLLESKLQLVPKTEDVYSNEKQAEA
jgi:hypothetical protein